ncbi:MAG: histidine kinase [Gemmatimonadetes bacterium]|nr:histidine kinase [Gemmatimonadota bacterium]
MAIDAIGQLSAQLRHAITASQKDWSTIGEELQFVRGYVALQALRYPERLRVTVDAPAAAESFPVRPCSCSRWSKTPSATTSNVIRTSRRSTSR